MSGVKASRYLMTVLAVSGMLALSACAPAGPALPPSISQPSGVALPSPSPSVAPVEKTPLAPSTAVVSASGVQTNGLPQYPALEERALAYTGIKESPVVVPKELPGSRLTPVQKVVAAGGTAPTADYVLNLTYKLCTTTQMYRDQGLGLNDALVKAAAEVPGWVGFSSSEDATLATAYLDVVMTSYSYICVPLFDERARADLEKGIYRG